MLSIVVPIHNEEHSILPLYDRLTSVLFQLGRSYEILFVDDASTDRSYELLSHLVQTDPRLKVIRLRRNFGQTAALAAGCPLGRSRQAARRSENELKFATLMSFRMREGAQQR